MSKNSRIDIDYRTQRFLIGAIALVFPVICMLLFWMNAGKLLQPISISVTYFFSARDVFVGMLFIVGGFLAVYKGYTDKEAWLAKLAALSALVVAMVPTSVDLEWVEFAALPFDEARCNFEIKEKCVTSAFAWMPHLHYVAAIALIGTLFVFCLGFLRRAKDKLKAKPELTKIKRRIIVYRLCSLAMPASLLYPAYLAIADKDVIGNPALFYVEWVCLWAFAISWIVASRQLRALAYSDDQETDAEIKAGVAPHHKGDPVNEVDNERVTNPRS